MKYGTEQINEMQSIIDAVNKEFSDLSDQKSSLIAQKEGLEKEFASLSGKLGWKEKYLSGYLGGNKELVQEATSSQVEIQKIEEHLASVDQKLKEKPERLRKEISSFLQSNDPEYAELIASRKSHFKLYEASKAYYGLVKKSHQGVIDALLFLSWEKLINHPEAGEKLAEFKKATSDFQVVVDNFIATTKHQLGDRSNLVELIKLSSQHVAMSSFENLIKQVKYYTRYTDKYLKKSKGEIQEYRSTAFELLIQD